MSGAREHACAVATAAYRLAPLLCGAPRHRGNAWVVEQLENASAEEVKAGLLYLVEAGRCEAVTADSIRAVMGEVQERYKDITVALLEALRREHVNK